MKKGMSELEQRLYFTLGAREKRVYGISDIVHILKISKYHARNIASGLVRKGAAERVKSGLFVRVPESVILEEGPYREDMVIIASKLCKEYFISNYTALRLNGLANRYSNMVYISSPVHQRSVTFHTNTFRFIKIKRERFFGVHTLKYYNEEVAVSDIERTIIDVIGKPRLSGGLIEAVNCLKNLVSIKEKVLLDYLALFNNKKTARIIGYLLCNLASIEISDIFRKKIKELSGKSKYYIDQKRGGFFEKEWNLIIPYELRKELNDQ